MKVMLYATKTYLSKTDPTVPILKALGFTESGETSAFFTDDIWFNDDPFEFEVEDLAALISLVKEVGRIVVSYQPGTSAPSAVFVEIYNTWRE